MTATRPNRPVSTYSIVARDPVTGQLGVAVQSHWFSVGTVVSWAESGVGVVATQALADPGYGPRGLELMRQGASAPVALQKLLDDDPQSDIRQVAFVDAAGEVATHTGDRCIAEAGHVGGEGFSVQANIMHRATVWGAMSTAYSSAEGDLVDRLLAALDAAEGEGGDIRGKQSAALLVVSGEPTGRSWDDRIFDLRVEDHSEPLSELRRLTRLRRAYINMTAGDDAMGAGDIDQALEKYSTAADLVPENPEMPFWNAVGLVGVGRVDDALPTFSHVFEMDRSWRDLIPRLVSVGLLEADERTIDRILGV